MASGAYIASQNLVPAQQIPTAISIIIFCQSMGGAVSLIAANAIFSNTLRNQLQQHTIINPGARSVRQLVSGERLAVVVQAYSNSVDTVMYFGIAVSVAAFAFARGLGWKDIRVEKELNGSQVQGSDVESIERNGDSQG
ncbi:efflux pump afoB [Parachaetomium inaequale]|uniref:Efflux pump afoB n=1 Tax=Parachaetomium inaequale TaxID=2588326 RepID=A0AAN6SKV0_9PEZI|nr:efflux pump afoB [Parachaetomium inaequale]